CWPGRTTTRPRCTARSPAPCHSWKGRLATAEPDPRGRHAFVKSPRMAASGQTIVAAVPALIVIAGNQDAGKSTASGRLARRFDRCALVAGDEMQGLLVAGGLWPEGQ